MTRRVRRTIDEKQQFNINHSHKHTSDAHATFTQWVHKDTLTGCEKCGMFGRPRFFKDDGHLPRWTVYYEVFQRSARFKFKHLRSSRTLFCAVHEKPQCMVHKMRSSQFKIHAVQVHAFSRSRLKFTARSSPSRCTAQFTARSATQCPSAILS
jgi:hypothetical protein